MKTLLFILLSLGVSAQSLTNTQKIIYKSVLKDTVTVSFTPIGEATLTVKTYGETIDDHVQIIGNHVLEIALDTAEAITVEVKGSVNYKITKKVVDVTPVPVSDNSLSEIKVLIKGTEGRLVSSFTAAEKEAWLEYLMHRAGVLQPDRRVKKVKHFPK